MGANASAPTGPVLEVDPRLLQSKLIDKATHTVDLMELIEAFDAVIPVEHRDNINPTFGQRMTAGVAEGTVSMTFDNFASFAATLLGQGGNNTRKLVELAMEARVNDHVEGLNTILLVAKLILEDSTRSESYDKDLLSEVFGVLPPTEANDIWYDNLIEKQFSGLFEVLRAAVETALLSTHNGSSPNTPSQSDKNTRQQLLRKTGILGRPIFVASTNVWRSQSTVPILKTASDEVQVADTILGRSRHATWSLPVMVSPKFSRSGQWTLLFSSRFHGNSTNRLNKQCFMYKGPTILLLKDENEHVFGCAIDSEWEESAKTWGGDDCRGFSLVPAATIYNGVASVYYNTRGRSGEHGLGVYTKGKKRIWLETDLKRGHRSMGPGIKAIGVPHTFDATSIEVWGCGDDSCLEAQTQSRITTAAVAEKAGKAKPLDWATDRDMLVMAGTSAGQNIAAGEAGRLEHEESRVQKLKEQEQM